MSWFKTDDLFYGHPKARRAGLEAIGLWTVAGSHAAAYKLPHGFTPEWFVESWPRGPELAEKLVKVGLWEPAEHDGEDGWVFHDWEHHLGVPAYRPPIPVLVAREVIIRDWPICQICGGEIALGEHHLDHIQPYCAGGDASVENLRVTHDICNIRRGAPKEWT